MAVSRLFGFLRRHDPDEASRVMFVRAHEDEARHVAYGTGRMRNRLTEDARAAETFVEGLEERVAFAHEVSGIPPEIQESLVTLASGAELSGHARGVEAVREFEESLSRRRIKRLAGSGFPAHSAQHISDLHARSAGNAM